MTISTERPSNSRLTQSSNEIIQFCFQPRDIPASVVEGTVKPIVDFGQEFSEQNGYKYGWVREDSLNSPGGPQPFSLVGKARKRNLKGTPAQPNTLIHMQDPPGFAAPSVIRAAWQYEPSLPGDYIVTVCVGDLDPNNTDSEHQINIQNKPVIPRFRPSPGKQFRIVTTLVTVEQGKRLTVDAIGGINSKLNYIIVAPAAGRPYVEKFTAQAVVKGETIDRNSTFDIKDGDENVPVTVALSPEFNIKPANENPGVDPASKFAAKLLLIKQDNTPQPISTKFTTSGGADTFTLRPSVAKLLPNTRYTLYITPDLQSKDGKPYFPCIVNFTTGEDRSQSNNQPGRFQRVSLPITKLASSNPVYNGECYTCVLVSPDGKQLYASTLDGKILRFNILSGGQLSAPKIFKPFGDRQATIICLCFQPGQDPSNPILWMSHGEIVDMREASERLDANGNRIIAADWSGTISRLSGPDLTLEPFIAGLPRSTADHMTTGIAFRDNDPTVLYILQGSNTAMGVKGGSNSNWGTRPERKLSAALLRADLSQIAALPPTQRPLNVKPVEEGGPYDLSRREVTLYATGFRSPFDMVFHSNGKLYVTNNGSAKGYPVPSRDGRGKHDNVPADRDYLFCVEPGGYYGHPNPTRGEFIMNGGNPTTLPAGWPWAASDYPRITRYPQGTDPLPKWKGYAYDFGLHASPTGLIEYKNNKLGLKGKLLAVCFNNHKNIAVLNPDPTTGNIREATWDFPGFTNLDESELFPEFPGDPLDLAENPVTGDLYVALLRRVQPFGGEIILLRPSDG